MAAEKVMPSWRAMATNAGTSISALLSPIRSRWTAASLDHRAVLDRATLAPGGRAVPGVLHRDDVEVLGDGGEAL